MRGRNREFVRSGIRLSTLRGSIGLGDNSWCIAQPAAIILAMFVTWAPNVSSQNVSSQQEHEHGVVKFPISCNEKAQDHFEKGLVELHHMMYEQARPHFSAAANADEKCAKAHWGIAMTSFQPLWHPTSDEGLARGKAAVAAARSIGAPTERERRYIAVVDAFFTDPEPAPAADLANDHEARLKRWKCNGPRYSPSQKASFLRFSAGRRAVITNGCRAAA